MLREITIGQYLPGDTVVHRLDPRTKIALTMLFIVNVFVIRDFWGYALSAAYFAAVLFLARIPPGYLYRGLRPVLILLFITFFLNLFLVREGSVIFQAGPLSVTEDGFNTALFMALRLVMLVVAASILTLTTSPIDLTDGIESLLSPLKRIGVPAHEVAMMMSIALRFIPTLLEEADKIIKAQKARGADFETGNVLRRARGLIPVLVPLFISAFRRADALAVAMEARCYRGGTNRTRLRQLAFEGIDAWAVFFGLLYSAGLWWLRFR